MVTGCFPAYLHEWRQIYGIPGLKVKPRIWCLHLRYLRMNRALCKIWNSYK